MSQPAQARELVVELPLGQPIFGVGVAELCSALLSCPFWLVLRQGFGDLGEIHPIGARIAARFTRYGNGCPRNDASDDLGNLADPEILAGPTDIECLLMDDSSIGRQRC